jgi:hypothetical protein
MRIAHIDYAQAADMKALSTQRISDYDRVSTPSCQQTNAAVT